MNDPADQPRPDPPRLIPALGIFSATMLVAGGVIGSGIFRKPGVVAAQVGSPELLLGVWLLAGVVSLLGTLSNAELASDATHRRAVRFSPARLWALRGVSVRLGAVRCHSVGFHRRALLRLRRIHDPTDAAAGGMGVAGGVRFSSAVDWRCCAVQGTRREGSGTAGC